MKLVRQVRLELTIPCLRGRCLDPIWLLTHGGTERTRTVIDLIDNQAPNLSATVPILAMIWVGRRELNPHGPQSQCGALPIELRPTKNDKPQKGTQGTNGLVPAEGFEPTGGRDRS